MPSDQTLGLRLANPPEIFAAIQSAGARAEGRDAKKQAVANLLPLLIDAKALAALLMVSRATIDRWESGGRLPRSIKPSPGVKRWRRDEIQEWVAAGCPCRTDWESIKRSRK